MTCASLSDMVFHSSETCSVVRNLMGAFFLTVADEVEERVRSVEVVERT